MRTGGADANMVMPWTALLTHQDLQAARGPGQACMLSPEVLKMQVTGLTLRAQGLQMHADSAGTVQQIAGRLADDMPLVLVKHSRKQALNLSKVPGSTG